MVRRAVAVGIAVVAAGVLLAVAPDLAVAAGLDLPTLAIVLVGVACLFLAYVGIQSRRRTRLTYVDLPAVESRRAFDRPGDDFASDLDAVRRSPRTGRRRERVHDRLRETAIATLEAEGHTEERAHELLVNGEWTDDEVAAAFFGGDPGSRSWREHLRAVVAREPPFVRRARRVVAVLDRRTEGPG